MSEVGGADRKCEGSKKVFLPLSKGKIVCIDWELFFYSEGEHYSILVLTIVVLGKMENRRMATKVFTIG